MVVLTPPPSGGADEYMAFLARLTGSSNVVLREQAYAELVKRPSYPGQRYRHGWIPVNPGGTDVATAPARPPHKRSGGGKKSKEARPKPQGVDPQARKTMLKLAAGKKTTINPGQVDALMHAIKEIKPPPFNLANLQVRGPGNGNLFQRHLRDRPRETMPQLPTGFGADGATVTGRRMEDFEEFLNDKGVKFEYGTMDPRQLVASQSELSGPKVAKLYGFMREGGWMEGGVMIVARHGDGDGDGEWVVVDGHHRWAGAAAASIARGESIDVDVMFIDAGIDEVLGTPEDQNGIVMDFASFEGLATDREA